jgi:Domain of unknown function (DUF4177)
MVVSRLGEFALMAYEYKCVSGPTIVAVKNTKVRDQAVKAFEDIMNAEAEHGWEFVGIDEFHVSEPQGLLSRKRVYVPAKILVFRREKAGSLLAEALKARNMRVEPTRLPAPPSPGPDVNAAAATALPLEKVSDHAVVEETIKGAQGASIKSIVNRIKGNSTP